MNRKIENTILGLSLGFIFLACEPPAQEEPQRPNIIYIMSDDDHAYQAISAMAMA